MIEDKERFIEDYMDHNIFTLAPSTREMIRD